MTLAFASYKTSTSTKEPEQKSEISDEEEYYEEYENDSQSIEIFNVDTLIVMNYNSPMEV